MTTGEIKNCHLFRINKKTPGYLVRGVGLLVMISQIICRCFCLFHRRCRLIPGLLSFYLLLILPYAFLNFRVFLSRFFHGFFEFGVFLIQSFSAGLQLFLAPAEPLIEQRPGRRFNPVKWLKKKRKKG
jgi:hypothetical protein